MRRAVKRVLNPSVTIPIVVAAGVVALLVSLGDPRKIVGLVLSFQRGYLPWFFLLMLVYEVIRLAQWRYLLEREGVHVPVRAQIFSFAGGETTKSMPMGNFFQNYLLSAVAGTSFAYSSAVTTIVILFEDAVSLTALLILGLDGWTWLRPLIVVGLAAAVGAAWVISRAQGTVGLPQWVLCRERPRRAVERCAREVRQFREGARNMLRWRVLATSYMLSAGYLITAGAAFYLVLLGLGVTQVSLAQALAVFFFSLALGLLIPLPVDIGIAELSGVGALLALSVDRSAAVSAVLLFRVLSVGSSVVIALLTAGVLNDQLRKALRARR